MLALVLTLDQPTWHRSTLTKVTSLFGREDCRSYRLVPIIFSSPASKLTDAFSIKTRWRLGYRPGSLVTARTIRRFCACI